MTYLDWGCDPLKEECGSCLDAICNACEERFRKNRAAEIPEGFEILTEDSEEPDCDHCDLEKKPRCTECLIILKTCTACDRNAVCEFRLCGNE